VLLLVSIALAGSQCEGKPVAAATAKQAQRIIDDLRKHPTTIVPDGILNRTKCVVVFPASNSRSIAGDGTVSCRAEADKWKEPVAVHFVHSKPRAQLADLLIFILTVHGVRVLGSSGLVLGEAPGSAPGIVSHSKPVEGDKLGFDSLTYERRAGRLIGARVTAVIRADESLESLGPSTPDRVAHDSLTKSLISYFNSINPSGIIIHHSGTIPSSGKVPNDLKQVDSFHQARGMSVLCSGKVYHVAYHYLIFPDGRIKHGRPEQCQGAHAVGYNSYLGISLVGDFSSADNPHGKKGLLSPTQKQMASLVKLCRQLMGRYKLPLKNVLRHSDVATTECPGDRFPFSQFVRQLARSAARPSSMAAASGKPLFGWPAGN